MTTADASLNNARPEVLKEYVDSRGAEVRLDRPASLLQGVKLLGLASRNGRRYQESALRNAIKLYEGAKVNVNHPEGDPLSPRDYRDRIGVIRGVGLRQGEGLFGSLHFNPKHPLAEQLAWDAEHAPQNVGFSHNVLARTRREGSELVVESIDKVQSVDLVADPATTNGLFEETSPRESPALDSWKEITLESLARQRPDLLAELTQQHRQKLAQQAKQLEDLSARQAAAMRRERILELLMEHGLPLPGSASSSAERIVSETFLETLETASDEEQLEQRVLDRAAVVNQAVDLSPQVVAREQRLAVEQQVIQPDDEQDFVAAVTSQ